MGTYKLIPIYNSIYSGYFFIYYEEIQKKLENTAEKYDLKTLFSQNRVIKHVLAVSAMAYYLFVRNETMTNYIF